MPMHLKLGMRDDRAVVRRILVQMVQMLNGTTVHPLRVHITRDPVPGLVGYLDGVSRWQAKRV